MKKTKILAFCRRIVLALAAVIIGVRVYAWNAENLVGNRMPMPFGYGAAVVLSGSMEPVLSVNDVIIAQKTEDYAVGDMIVYQDGGSVVVHRVVTLDEETVQTRGDANNVADAPISRFLLSTTREHISQLPRDLPQRRRDRHSNSSVSKSIKHSYCTFTFGFIRV